MRNIYAVRLGRCVKIEPSAPHFSGTETVNLFVVASSFASAIRAVEAKYPGAVVKGVDMMNYTGVPIVVGD